MPAATESDWLETDGLPTLCSVGPLFPAESVNSTL